MLGKTHAAIGTVTGALLLTVIPETVSLPFHISFIPSNEIEELLKVACTVFGATILDVDEPHSRIARKLTPYFILSRRFTLILLSLFLIKVGLTGTTPTLLSSLILGGWLLFAEFSKHRGFTHSPIGFIIFAFGSITFNHTLGLYVTIGYVTHLIADILSDHGISYKWPAEGRFWIPTGLRTGSRSGDLVGKAQVAVSRIIEFGIRTVAYAMTIVILVQRFASINLLQFVQHVMHS